MSSFCRQLMDFEHLSKLASQDPDGFEAVRHEMIEELIDSASERCRRRLRGLQWQIDQVRVHSTNPMAACVSLSNMMWESFAGEEGLADTLNRRHDSGVSASMNAKVIPLPHHHPKQ